VGPTRAERYWQYETQGHVVGQPVVGDDGTVYVGSRDHYVYALTPTGGLRWRRDLGADVYATPALHDGLLYVGSDANFFFVLDADDGEVRVHLRTEGDVDTGIAVGADGTAYFGAGAELWAVGPDGTVRFRFRVNDKVFSAPAVDDDGTVYFGAQDDHLYALAPDGTLRWSFQARNDIDSGPVIGDDGTIYFGSDDHYVYALDRNGALRWRTDVGGYVRTPVALGLDGDVLVPVFGPHARLVSLDAASGQERWTFSVSRTDSNELGVGSSPLVDRDGNIYFGADDDYVYAIDRGGRMRWIHPTGGNVDGDPVLAADGTLIIGSDDRAVHALRADPPAPPTQPEPAQPEPAQPEPAQPEPAQPEPAQLEPAQPEPAQPPTEAAQPVGSTPSR
jgi:outer membrane protein assembly factor BamB